MAHNIRLRRIRAAVTLLTIKLKRVSLVITVLKTRLKRIQLAVTLLQIRFFRIKQLSTLLIIKPKQTQVQQLTLRRTQLHLQRVTTQLPIRLIK